MDCSPPGSSVHGISQARILQWVAISSSRGIFPTQRLNSLPLVKPGQPRDQTCAPWIGSIETTREVPTPTLNTVPRPQLHDRSRGTVEPNDAQEKDLAGQPGEVFQEAADPRRHPHTALPLPTLSHLSHGCSLEYAVFNARAWSYINKVVKFKGKPDGDPRGSHADITAGGRAGAERGGGSFRQCSFWDRGKGQSVRD